jgi:hypothetical protein
MKEAHSGHPYSRLFEALQKASLEEIRLQQFIHANKGGNTGLAKHADDIVSIKLPSLMGKLINRYELQNAFLSLARYIRSFSDAAFVIDKLVQPLTERMPPETAHGEAENIIACAMEYTDIVKQCIEV